MQRHYYGLDGARFFAALMVCLFHLAFYSWASRFTDVSEIFAHRATFEALTPFAWFGWVGVQVFFVISGFVIAASANGATPMAFLRSRALRLLPAAWVCATLSLAIWLVLVKPWSADLGWEYARSLVLWPKGSWIDGAYWSLAVEIAFYAIVFVLLLSKSFRRLPVLAWSLTVASAAFISLSSLHIMKVFGNTPWYQTIADQAEFLPLKHGIYFALGIWMWMLANRMLPRSAWAGMPAAGGFALAEIWVRSLELRYVEAPVAISQSAFVPMLVWLACLAAMLAFTRWPDAFNPKSKARQNLLKQAGKITYPLYLVHAVVGTGAMRWMIEQGAPPYAALLAALALVLGTATLVALVAEPVLRRALGHGLNALERRLKPLRSFGALFRPADAITLPKVA